MTVFAPQARKPESHTGKHQVVIRRSLPVPVASAFMHSNGTALQRKPNCACGGGCPSCQKKSDNFKVQTKLAVSSPGDEFEQEADAVADQVMRMTDPALQKQCSDASAPSSNDEGLLIKRQANGAGGRGEVASDFTSGLGSVNDVLRSTGQPLDESTRSLMQSRLGYDFTPVRVHADDQAADSASSLSARAYTVGEHIVFGAGEYQPGNSRGQQLIAHELTHVVQQTRPRNSSTASRGNAATGVVQRVLTEEQLATTSDTAIRQDPDYLDNRITRIEFYTAELAIIHYEDGSQFRLGLVPGLIQAPVVGVDYRTPRSEHAVLASPGPGQSRFLPRARQIRAPGMTSAEVFQQFGRTIEYHVAPGSRRIVPTEVNDITAPRLCEVLRRAEAEYIRSTDELARGMVRALQVLEIAVIIASFIPTGGESAGVAATRGAGTAGAAEAGVLARAVGVLRAFFVRLLRSGATEAITVEGVGFGGVRVLMSEGRVMTVLRNTIVNVERIPGQGRLIHSAFEQAAVAAAREVGATSVRVGMETVVNAQWAAYLESLGYAVEVIPNAAGGFSRVLMRTLTL